MKRSIVILVGVAIGIVGATSIELPICTAPGDQFYPDVCWDGEAFWVVWQDEELGTIRGVRVSEAGEFLTDEVEFFNKGSFQGPLRHPVVAAGRDRISAEARVMLFYNEFGSKTWGIMHNEFTFDGEPIHPYPMVLGSYDKEVIQASTPCLLFGEKYFFSFHRYSKETPIDFHASSVGWSFDPEAGKAYLMWESSEVQLEFYPPTACWDGERFVVLFWDARDQVQKGAFFSDSIYYKEPGEDFSLGFMVMNYQPNDLQGTIKYQAFAAGGTGYFIVSERGGWHHELRHQMVFHILDSTVVPLEDSGRVVGFGDRIDCYYPDVVFNGEHFQCVWENRSEEAIDLYSIKVDTLGEIVDSGYLVYGSDTAWHPAAARGAHECLIVWSDNRNGDFNVYGTFQDAVDITEKSTQDITHKLEAYPNPFTDKVRFTTKGGKETTLLIFDALGRRVNTLRLRKGEEAVAWDGRDSRGDEVPSGIYFVSLNLPDCLTASTTRIVKLK